MLKTRKTKIRVAIALSLMLSASSSAFAANVTSTTDVNVRSGPSMSCSVLTVMGKGTSTTNLGASNGWTKVSVNGKTGFVYSKYLSSSSQSVSSNSSTTSTQTVTITASSLNVRSGAGTQYSSIGGLAKGANATAISTTGDWYKIKYGSGYGYINKKYTSTSVSSNKKSSSTNNQGSSTKTMYCTASSLNVRSGAGTSYAVTGNVKEGQSVTVLSSSNGWSKIKVGNGYGYVSSKYLSESKTVNNTYRSGTVNSSDIIAYAKSFIGCKYVWGATGPSTFDCSGLTQYVFKHFGISIPRVSADQYSSAKKVTWDGMKAGDLVFFSNSTSGNNVAHVGIYIGNNQMIHSSSTGGTVCISNINSNYYKQHYIGSGRYL